RNKLGNGALSSLALVVKVPVTVSLERNGTERTDDEIGAEVDEVELLARCVCREDFVEVHGIADEIVAPKSESTVQVAHQDATSLFFDRQGGRKIALPADHLIGAEERLEFIEVQLRYLHIDFIRDIGFRLVYRHISFTLPAED